jgi:hypothetical protein
MVYYRDYAAGWLDSSVASFLEDFPTTYERLKFALITCIDSNTNPSSMLRSSPELSGLRAHASSLGQGIVIPTRRLIEAGRVRRLFFGFDEVWFFPNRPVEPKPDSGWIVGPSVISDETFEQLGGWMMENSCSLALGDGDGLNLIIKARGLVRNLIGQTIKQSLHGSDRP